MTDSNRIQWASRIRPILLKQLYLKDSQGLIDDDLCQQLGIALYARCETFILVTNRQVRCPWCGSVFIVKKKDASYCSNKKCSWEITNQQYVDSIRNYYAYPGRAIGAYLNYYKNYPQTKTYRQRIILIDQLIHSFHIDEKTGKSVKSIASKLLEGNKKEVVKFLDDLSEVDGQKKTEWRSVMSNTINANLLKSS